MEKRLTASMKQKETLLNHLSAQRLTAIIAISPR
jgi:hypothetical protein